MKDYETYVSSTSSRLPNERELRLMKKTEFAIIACVGLKILGLFPGPWSVALVPVWLFIGMVFHRRVC